MRNATLILAACTLAACMSHTDAQGTTTVDLCEPQNDLLSSYPARCCESLCGLVCEDNLLESSCVLEQSGDSSPVECLCAVPWHTKVQVGVIVWVLNVIVACLLASCIVLRHLTSSHPIDPTPETITSFFTLTFLFGMLGLVPGRLLMGYQMKVMRKRGLTTSTSSSSVVRGSRSDSSHNSIENMSPRSPNRVYRTESTSPRRAPPLPPVPTAVFIDTPTVDNPAMNPQVV